MLLTTALLLVLLAILADLGRARPWVLAAAVVLAAWVGTTLPDIDQPLGIGHRSGLTHSILPAAAAALHRHWRAIAAGLALGIALHLAADVFPNGMRGYALVKLPGFGALDAGGSYGWLALNAVLALAGGVWLVVATHPPRLAQLAFAAVVAMGLAYLFRTDGGWWVLTLMLIGAATAAWRRRALFRTRSRD